MKIFFRTSLAAAIAVSAACTMQSQDAPPLTGPSETALSIEITATPDQVSRDGGSQATIRVLARDENGQPISGMSVRLDIVMDGVLVDCGQLSARTLSTNASGIATASYTAPSGSPCTLQDTGDDSTVRIFATPIGSNFDNTLARFVSIRLTPPGVITPPNGTPTATFTFNPSSPDAGDEVLFDASGSTDDGRIVKYEWNWGDGDSDTTTKATIQKDYETSGSFTVRLTVTDDKGMTASDDQPITVGAAATPQASFVSSPTDPTTATIVNFNASQSTAPEGRSIVKYEWDFGDGVSFSSTSSAKASHGYTAEGQYIVTLTVTDSAGQKASESNRVIVANDSL
jgi:PKD repeat protein